MRTDLSDNASSPENPTAVADRRYKIADNGQPTNDNSSASVFPSTDNRQPTTDNSSALAVLRFSCYLPGINSSPTLCPKIREKVLRDARYLKSTFSFALQLP